MSSIKQIHAHGYTHWLITWNNYPEDAWLKLCMVQQARYICGQKEISPSGTPHFQCYAYFEDAITTKKAIRLFQGCHVKGVAPADGQIAYNYCHPDHKPEDKKDTIVQDSWVEWGIKPKFRKPERGLDAFAQTLQFCKDNEWENSKADHQVKYFGNLTKLAAHYATGADGDAPRGIWLFGKAGAGKSYYARHNYSDPFFIKPQSKWWCNYRGEPTVILDDLDKGGACLSHYIKIWADQYATKGEIKGASVSLNYKRFIITSQYLPKDLWPGDEPLLDAIHRRFLFLEILDRKALPLDPRGDPEALAYFAQFMNNI